MSDEIPPRPGRLRFGPFEFDPVTGELWKQGNPVRLQQQPAKILALLASHPGELLSREQIRHHVWSEGTFVDFQRGLNFAIMQIRTALGDEAESPRYVETLARRGYRFVAPVATGEAPGPSPALEPTHSLAEGDGLARPTRRVLGRRVLVPGAAALALTVAVWALWWPAAPAPASGRKMIVVVPFKNLGPSEEQFFADGITDEVTSRLASIRGLGVISPTSAQEYAGTSKSIRQIGAELGVEYVLEGSVRWEGSGSGPKRVRVTPRLVRVSDQVQLWSRIWERETGEVLRLQSDLAREVIGELDVSLRASERGTLERVPTSNPAAYEAYLRGKSAAGRYAAPDVRLAIDLFERAVELDPGFALAWTDLSYCRSLLYHHSPPDAEEQLAPALAAAEKALALDPGLAQAHLALGYYHYWGRKDYPRALEEFAIAERGLPGHSQLLTLLGAIRRRQGRLDEALAKEEEAIALSPRDGVAAWDVGTTYMMLGRSEDAARAWERAIALAPDSGVAYRDLATLRLQLGDTEAARRILDRAPGPPPPLLAGTIEYYAGDYQAALRWLSLAPAEAGTKDDRARDLHRAWVFEALGSQEQAQAAFRAARAAIERALQRRPEDPLAHSDLGLTLAGLGLKEAALNEGKRAVAIVPVSVDAVIGPALLVNLARIQCRVGEREAALDQIERVLSLQFASYLLSPPLLRLDPSFRPLRDHPRFRRIVERSN